MEQKLKLRKANKDPDVEILLHDAMNFHFKCTRVTVIPGNEQFPSRLSTVRQFKPEILAKLTSEWPRIANYQEARLIHDPTLLTELELKEAQAALDLILKPKPLTPGSVEAMAAEMKRIKRQMRNKV